MDYTIKDLPKEERPREKLEKHGSRSLTNVELLSIVLRTGIQGKNVKELSGEVLGSYSLSSLADLPLNELENIEGISRVKAGQLVAVGELARRMKKEKREEISNFSDVEARVKDMRFFDQEMLRVFHLSAGNELLAEEEFEGGISAVELDLQKLFRSALKEGAAAVVLAHNHPSRDASPTEQDISTTREAIEVGKKLGLEVLDHVIIGDEISSMRVETGLDF